MSQCYSGMVKQIFVEMEEQREFFNTENTLKSMQIIQYIIYGHKSGLMGIISTATELFILVNGFIISN